MRYKKLYPAVICFCVFLAAIGLVLGDPSTVLPGLWKIIVTEDALITDYVKIAGVSAALVNSALVTLVSLLLLYLSKEPPNGFTLVELGLMAGFSLFGKNIVNIWPIIAGTFLYAKARREPFGKYVSVSLLATALAPVVSYVALDNGFGNLWWGIAVGLLIGFVLPPLSAYTYKIQNGMNLYNMGFACGLLAMILVPVMSSMGANPTVAHHWAEGYNLHFAIFLGVLCLGLTVAAAARRGPPGRGTAACCAPPAGLPAITFACLGLPRCSSTWGSTGSSAWPSSSPPAAISTAQPWAAFSPSWASPPSVSTPATSPPSCWAWSSAAFLCTGRSLTARCSWRCCSAPRWRPFPAISAGPLESLPASCTPPWCSTPVRRSPG